MTKGLHYSMDVLGPEWSSHIPASSDYVDPIYHKVLLDYKRHVISG